MGRVVSAEGVKPDTKAVAKLRDWEIPRNKTEMQSFLGFANYYREFIPWHAKLVAPLHAVTGLNVTFTWGPDQQKAFNEIKKALIDSEGEFVLDTDASAVAISGILHQWQGPPGERPETDSVWQQEAHDHTSQVWSSQTGNICSLLLHCEKKNS